MWETRDETRGHCDGEILDGGNSTWLQGWLHGVLLRDLLLTRGVGIVRLRVPDVVQTYMVIYPVW